MSQDEALPRSEIALEALKEIRALLDDWEGSDWSHTRPVQDIDHILHMAYARLRMASLARTRRDAPWLAKVDSMTWPRRIEEDGKTNVAICFNVIITDGAKAVRGKKIEVRMPFQEAADLGKNMADWSDGSDGGPRTEEGLADLLPVDKRKRKK